MQRYWYWNVGYASNSLQSNAKIVICVFLTKTLKICHKKWKKTGLFKVCSLAFEVWLKVIRMISMWFLCTLKLQTTNVEEIHNNTNWAKVGLYSCVAFVASAYKLHTLDSSSQN